VSLVRAGAFLVAASARNRVRQAVRKLREPRYLVGAAAMALYLWSFLLRGAFRSHPEAGALPLQASGLVRLGLELSVTAVGAIAVFSTWTLGQDRLSFSFSEAEVTWLLSGPLSRRAVVRYKVAVGLLRTLLSAVVVTLLFRRGLAAALLPLVVATALSFALVWLHSALASMVRVGWHAAGTSPRWRLSLGALLLGAGVLLASLGLRAAGPFPSLSLDKEALFAEATAWLQRCVHAPAVAWALVPARAVLDAAAAHSLAQALGPLAILSALTAGLLLAVLLLDVPLEEAALASAERRARLEARRRRRGLPTPRLSRLPKLRSTGPPELALAWKNWAALRRLYGAGLGVLVVSLGVGAGLTAWAVLRRTHSGDARLLGALVALLFAGFTFFFGPLSTRTDLRADLRRLDVLRTLPLSGLQVVRGELLAPALLLAATEVALLVLALGLSAGSPLRGFPLAARLGWTAGLALLLPAATASLLVVQNAAALVFPSLLVDDEERAPRGVEATGSRLLSLGASLLLLLVGFLPAGVVGLLIGLLSRWGGLGALSSTLGCAGAAAVLAGEIHLALLLMGRGLERLDPTRA
jgi:ABC-2 type transport system permease protein